MMRKEEGGRKRWGRSKEEGGGQGRGGTCEAMATLRTRPHAREDLPPICLSSPTIEPRPASELPLLRFSSTPTPPLFEPLPGPSDGLLLLAAAGIKEHHHAGGKQVVDSVVQMYG